MFNKAFVFSLFAFAACATAQATTVLNTVDPTLLSGTFSSGQTGFSMGSSIAESFITGSSILTLSNVVFPQITQNASGTQNFDGYLSTETFALYADSTLSGIDRPAPVALFNFSLQNDPTVDPMKNPATFGETTATVPTIDTGLATLLPNTRYWLVLANTGTEAAWNYYVNTSYGSALGFTLPATDTVITEDGGESITNLSDGPQQFVLNVTPLGGVPEPSTYCLMAVAGLALVVSRKRLRKVA